MTRPVEARSMLPRHTASRRLLKRISRRLCSPPGHGVFPDLQELFHHAAEVHRTDYPPEGIVQPLVDLIEAIVDCMRRRIRLEPLRPQRGHGVLRLPPGVVTA